MNAKPTKSKVLKICLLVLIPIGIVTVVIFYRFSAKTAFTDSFSVGNTAGNLYNGGLFCEYNGIVYFSNPHDNHSLYSMSRNGTEVTKIYDDVSSYINVDDNYVYYTRNNGNDDTAFSFLRVQNNSLCRVDRDGNNIIFLDSEPSLYASQIGNYIYYVHYDKKTASTLYRVKIDGSEQEMVVEEPIIPAGKSGQYLYYSGVAGDHNIHKIDAISKNHSIAYEGNCYNPIVDGEYAYFMDCDSNYSLAKVHLPTGEKTLITNDRADCYNVYGSWIYYQRNGKSPALCRIQADGTGFEEVMDGNYTNINITSSYVYFTGFDDDNTYFQTPTIGNVNVTTFRP